MFAVRATYHTTLQASPMQLVFGRDDILNIKHVAEWEHIWQRKQLRINHNNKRENMRRNNHQYKVGDKILVKCKKNYKHKLEFMGPFPITKINDNGTVCFQKGIINNAVNIRRINHSLTKQKEFLQQRCFSLKHMIIAWFTFKKESSMLLSAYAQIGRA